MLLVTPGRVVPPAFFRTHCLVMLGMLVLAAWDLSRDGADRLTVGATVLAGALAYAASVGWGIGLPRVGLPLTAGTLAMAVFALLRLAATPSALGFVASGLGRLTSAALLGSTLSAMLLGHHYLTAPTMSIEPLVRFVRYIGATLVFRALVAAGGLALYARMRPAASTAPGPPLLFLAIRWGMGILALAIAVWMAKKTVEIRSTQSATGILYVAFAFVLFGELTASLLERDLQMVM
jgi:hypothetical protein